MLKKELIGLLICTLLITVAVAPSINALTINRHNVDSQQSVTVSNGELIDSVEIECKGIKLVEIPLAILWLPVFYIQVRISNDNDVPVSVNRYIELETQAGRVLYEFDHELPFKLKPDHQVATFYFTRRAWKEKDYITLLKRKMTNMNIRKKIRVMIPRTSYGTFRQFMKIAGEIKEDIKQ